LESDIPPADIERLLCIQSIFFTSFLLFIYIHSGMLDSFSIELYHLLLERVMKDIKLWNVRVIFTHHKFKQARISMFDLLRRNENVKLTQDYYSQ
jgi:hypothetical protein